MCAMSSPWTAAQMPRLDGTRVVVTGATRGLGEATARGAADAGATVVVAGRGADAAAQVARSIGGGATPAVLDLTDRDSIHAFAESVGDIDVLIHNAGVLPTRRTVTADGHETTLATNVLGPFLLTNLLAPRIRDRVVAVNSTVHHAGRLDLDDLDFTRRRFTGAAAYSQSKLAQALWMLALDRRLRAARSDLTTALTHPGWAATEITALPGVPALTPFITWLGNTVANSVVEGAACTLYAATMPIPSGSFVGPAGFGGLRGSPTLVGRSATASDTALAERFWDAAAELTGSELHL
ncbi:NADP-dependent 3-hydroxy acid dehydrogenase YdfG [Williamsia maris]|uniref:NADP-dependent 3-hydroxy acid dehydrogenase YdfG n=2 Tax=Williamsia maris TaxID=72806 RepID=A0ABT1H8F0_9NOCA|nr:NADP-dependent 3-hydroxy acid dehydrogenase YdfG [Williamsia maris]